MQNQYLLSMVVVLLSAACARQPTAESEVSNPSESETVATEAQGPRSYEGPFGLKAGISPEEAKRLIPGLSSDAEDVYSAVSVPKSHGAFESYLLAFSKKSGLCAVSGIGKDIDSGQAGAEIRLAFSALEEGLESKYGQGKSYDFATGLMDDPQYWMIALSDKNRTLATIWNKKDGATLPAEISSIALQAHASDMSTGYINLRYEFSNISDCSKESKEQENEAL